MASVIEGGELALKCMAVIDETMGERVTNVAYLALVKEPLRIVREIYERFGVNEPSDIAERIQAFIAAQAQGKRAARSAGSPRSPILPLDNSSFNTPDAFFDAEFK